MTDDEQKRIFSKNLLKYLNLYGKTQREVADAISVSPQTFNTWCQGIALPRMGKIQKLSDYFNIEKTDLIDEDLSSSEKKHQQKDHLNYHLENHEISMMEKYRAIDDDGRSAVNYILDHEAKRAAAAQALREAPAAYAENITVLPTLVQRICAGTGSIGDDVLYEEGQYPAIKVPEGSQYAAAITGDSMEPEFHDGDIVFYKKVNALDFGDIGIFNINNENVIKKYGKQGLQALNPEYDKILPVADDHIVIIGKVLGKL